MKILTKLFECMKYQVIFTVIFIVQCHTHTVYYMFQFCVAVALATLSSVICVDLYYCYLFLKPEYLKRAL